MKIYLVLTKTGTFPSKLIHFWTKDEYTHISLSLDPNLSEFYSFGRLRTYNFLIGGFVIEKINSGIFKRFKNTTTSIYELPVSLDQFQKLQAEICIFKENMEDYKFNKTGFLLVSINKGYHRKDRFYCSEFVKYILNKSGIDTTNLPEFAKPEDFKQIKNGKLVYKGLLKDYK